MQATAEAMSKTGEGVPQLVDGWESQGLRLTPSEGFLLSRIDGATPWASLRQIAGMPAAQVDACLERWIAQGIVAVAPGPAAGEGAPAREDAAELDPALDLALDLQRSILAFEAGLDRPYHTLLGVPADADLRTIKRAFFALSKQYHPDRYFRRRVGAFGPRLERIFKRIALAYEMLSDPAVRAELERMPAAPAEPSPGGGADRTRAARGEAAAGRADRSARKAPPASAGDAGARPRRSRRRESLDRLRRRFRIPEEVLTERRFKARRLRDGARIAAQQGHLGEAASAMRLAIAFDPWCDEYKDAFAEIQSQLHQSRAAELIDRASAGSLAASGPEALRLLEEALHYRPSDARLQHRAAELALEAGEVERAREWAERACELAPEQAAHHSTLGRALRRAGERALARAAFERAQRLDPADPRAAEELDRLRRRRPARGESGGKR
jgi:curved DNA-binding protein CbpA